MCGCEEGWWGIEEVLGLRLTVGCRTMLLESLLLLLLLKRCCLSMNGRLYLSKKNKYQLKEAGKVETYSELSVEEGSTTILRLSPAAVVAEDPCMCGWKVEGTSGMVCSGILSSGIPICTLGGRGAGEGKEGKLPTNLFLGGSRLRLSKFC